jgi:hypothetical protein
VNVSRGGLLLACKQAHGVGHPLWVTIPFDPENASAQPETLARVVRCERLGNGGDPGWNVAMEFEGAPDSKSKGNGNQDARKNRNGKGTALALPIRVRPANVPWHEEAMTVEVWRDKLQFVTNREYAFGERLLVAFASQGELPWGADGEWETQVTGIEMQAGNESIRVTVRKKTK